jgi:hypothetical protein
MFRSGGVVQARNSFDGDDQRQRRRTAGGGFGEGASGPARSIAVFV